MSNYREQAIRDVAAALRFDAEVLAGMVRVDADLLCNAGPAMVYAVAQRERMLELEAFLEKVVNVNAASTEPDAAELSDALGGLAYEAMKLEAQLQQKEGERG